MHHLENKTGSKNDQSAPSESSKRGCTAAKSTATGNGMDFAYRYRLDTAAFLVVVATLQRNHNQEASKMLDFDNITDMQWLNLWSHIWTLRHHASYQYDMLQEGMTDKDWKDRIANRWSWAP